MEPVMVITGTTQLLGVMGYPIKHSLSPVMHNAAIDYLGLDYVYLPLAIEPAYLEQAVQGLAAIGWQGFNVTIPHKQSIMAYLTEISPIAQAVGAVNTVWRTPAGWGGKNTDITGFQTPLQKLERNWSEATAIVLGHGGSARAVVAALRELNCREIWVVGRDPDKLSEFRASWQNFPLLIDVLTSPWGKMDKLLPQADVVVNCTPIGMAPHQTSSPLSVSQIASLPATAIVYDLIYNPRPTQLLKLAAERGCQTIDGLEMLIYQGAAALETWIKQVAPIEVMRQAVLQHT
jgi:shikimate dehydrogenase